MGKGDRRHSLKMKRRTRQRKKKERERRKKESLMKGAASVVSNEATEE